MPDDDKIGERSAHYLVSAAIVSDERPALVVSARQLAKAIMQGISDYAAINEQPLNRMAARRAVGNGMRTITWLVTEAAECEPDILLPYVREGG